MKDASDASDFLYDILDDMLKLKRSNEKCILDLSEIPVPDEVSMEPGKSWITGDIA